MSSLSPEDRVLYSPCATSQELLGSLGKLDSLQRGTTKKLKWLIVISKFSARLEPFLKVVDIFVSSDPEYAALCWGALRLVLQACHQLFLGDREHVELTQDAVGIELWHFLREIHRPPRQVGGFFSTV